MQAHKEFRQQIRLPSELLASPTLHPSQNAANHHDQNHLIYQPTKTQSPTNDTQRYNVSKNNANNNTHQTDAYACACMHKTYADDPTQQEHPIALCSCNSDSPIHNSATIIDPEIAHLCKMQRNIL